MILERETRKRGCSSAGRAPALQAGGHGFEPHHLHQSTQVDKIMMEEPNNQVSECNRFVAQVVRAHA